VTSKTHGNYYKPSITLHYVWALLAPPKRDATTVVQHFVCP